MGNSVHSLELWSFGVTGRTEINVVLNWFEELTARVPGP